jgi:predicted dehydrogenase
MNIHELSNDTRREFLKQTGRFAAAATLAAAATPKVHAGEDNTIRIALVGCGGRGTSAAGDALAVQNGPIAIVALADVFEGKVKHTAEKLKAENGERYKVPEDQKFVGFDSYKKAMDCLKPGDIVILGTPPVFRWVHFKYAMDKGLNVFMEKPIAVDAPTAVKMFELGKESVKKNQKVGVGLMCRHCRSRGELYKRIKDGQIGELNMLRAYRIAGRTAKEAASRMPADEKSELLWQIKWFHSFLWASGGAFSDFLIHNVDECCWMKDAWPVEAQALGGRHYRGDAVDQNLDTYSVEYTFEDGAKLFLYGRTIDNCYTRHSSLAHGTKGSAIISEKGHMPSRARLFSNQDAGQMGTISDKKVIWRCNDPEPNPYRLEWEDLVAAVRDDKPYNEVERGAEASLQAVLGRMAAHTGQVIKRADLLKHDHEFAPDVDKLTLDSPAPLVADADGKYPVPMPGKTAKREY